MSEYTLTPNYALYKPTPGADDDIWGDHLNANADILDALIKTINGAISVQEHGAVGDGVTDDTAAIARAVEALPETGGEVYFPAGIYLVSSTTYLPSNVRVFGAGSASVLAGATTWTGTDPISGLTPNLAFFQNVNAIIPSSTPWTTYVDHDITIENLQFDYASTVFANALAKCIFFANVLNVTVRNCLFQCRGAQGATAFLASDTTKVEGCRAYDFVNCAYDHWCGPKRATIINNWARTAHSSQLVNFNPEPGGSLTGYTADTCIISGNILENTGTVGSALNLAPLHTGNFGTNITVTHNIIRGAIVVVRGATTNVLVSGNKLLNPIGGTWVIGGYSYGPDDQPDNHTYVGNLIVNPDTVIANVAVIWCQASTCVIMHNIVAGSTYGTVAGIQTSSPTAIVNSNYISNGVRVTTSASVQDHFFLAANKYFGWRDSSGNIIGWTLQTDDNLVMHGTDSTGANRFILAVQQHSDNSPFFVHPSTVLAAAAPVAVQINGGDGTAANPATVAPRSVPGDFLLRLLGLGNYGVLIDSFTSSAAPTTSVITPSLGALWKNTTDGTLKLYCNDGGTLKSVTLT